MNNTKDTDKIISLRLKGKLTEKKITQKILADELGVAEITISAKLNGKQAMSVGQFAYICAKHNFSNTDIFEVLNGATNIFLNSI